MSQSDTPKMAALIQASQARWQTCPVCFGKGIVPPNFYLTPGVQWAASNTSPEQCRSCGGKGIVR